MAKKWEYLVVELNGVAKDEQATLNWLGSDGWELVTVTRIYDIEIYSDSTYVPPEYDIVTAYLKREKD